MKPVKTVIKVNKIIYRMGFQARPLLMIVAAFLVISVVLVAALGYIGLFLVSLLVYGFVAVSKLMKKEIEKGNLYPIDDYLGNLNKPKELEEDYIIETLKERRFGETK